MKINILFLFLFFSSISLVAQESFVLKKPNIQEILQSIEETDQLRGAILIYLEKNYNDTSEKINIKKENDGKIECGFTKKFQFGILYSIEQCDEASLQTEKIVFPKIKLSVAKKWVELIYKAGITKIQNGWYGNTNEYGPKDREVGCYYKIEETNDETIINISCGC